MQPFSQNAGLYGQKGMWIRKNWGWISPGWGGEASEGGWIRAKRRWSSPRGRRRSPPRGWIRPRWRWIRTFVALLLRFLCVGRWPPGILGLSQRLPAVRNSATCRCVTRCVLVAGHKVPAQRVSKAQRSVGETALSKFRRMKTAVLVLTGLQGRLNRRFWPRNNVCTSSRFRTGMVRCVPPWCSLSALVGAGGTCVPSCSAGVPERNPGRPRRGAVRRLARGRGTGPPPARW